MPVNEKLPISKARSLRLVKDTKVLFCVLNPWNPGFVQWVGEGNGFKQKSLFNVLSLNSVVRLKAFEVSLLLGL